MFWRHPQPPKKMPLATTSPHTSANTTSRVWLALSRTARLSGDSQWSCWRQAGQGSTQMQTQADTRHVSDAMTSCCLAALGVGNCCRRYCCRRRCCCLNCHCCCCCSLRAIFCTEGSQTYSPKKTT
jgi:hypothetical protein